jgi:methylmalonyl-CoA/ethylmalonyl-CoA epimerase
MKTHLSLLLLSSSLVCAAALPDAYSNVDRVLFVVADADAAAQSWARAGIPVVSPRLVDITPQRAPAIRVRSASVFFENVTVDFIQPDSPAGPFADFLKRTKGGGMALVHALPDTAALDAEVKRLNAAGAATLLDATWKHGPESTRYVLFDTAKEGKYVLALRAGSDRRPSSATQRVTQYAFAARNLEAISAYWEKLGLPAMTYTLPETSELVYRGKPGQFGMRLGWQRHGKVPYEWIQALRGPSTYHDHLERHGEGFHHLAFNVDDMDRAIREWEQSGFPMVMGGAWGEKGKPGSGRFAYHDLVACCGAEIELLWNYRAR